MSRYSVSQLVNTYDQVPYDSYPYVSTHPDHLATIAVLLGLEPPQQPFRVLELGCASGGNLLPMAATHPDCYFVGIDHSSVQINHGNTIIQQAELRNVELHAMNILDVDSSLGEFDYILCHGVYSWVPREVQFKILELCQTLMKPNGIAYISYNTQPGWRQRGVLRDMMQYHIRRYPESNPKETVSHARGLLDFLVMATNSEDSSYARMLREQHDLLSQSTDAYIFHEHLEQHNEPLWFLDFCHRLETHGLRYLGEADFGSMVAKDLLSDELQSRLDQLESNLVEREQYLDFVRNRSFRQTLVCHAAQRPNYAVHGERIRSLWASTPGVVLSRPSVDDEPGAWELRLESGLSLTTSVKSTQLALEILSQAWPARILVSDLTERVAHELGGPLVDTQEIRKSVEVALLTAFTSSSGRLIDFSVSPWANSLVPSDECRSLQVHRLARHQAKCGLPVVNRRHLLIPVQPLDRRIIPLLDGNADTTSILSELVRQFQSGDLTISDEQGVPIMDQQKVCNILEQVIPERLESYHRNSLLYGK